MSSTPGSQFGTYISNVDLCCLDLSFLFLVRPSFVVTSPTVDGQKKRKVTTPFPYEGMVFVKVYFLGVFCRPEVRVLT